MNLFVYGTLMDADIMGRVTGSAYQSQEATLQEYSRRTVRGEVYPAIIKQSGCSVDGVVYFNISLVDIERLDKFEGSLYERIEVEVIFNNGERVSSHTYVISTKSAHQLSNDNWSYDNFLAKHKNQFQNGYYGYDELESS